MLDEVWEAEERAADARAALVADEYFNDADAVRVAVDQWLVRSPAVVRWLRDQAGAGDYSEALASWLTRTEEQFGGLDKALENDSPAVMGHWRLNAGAVLQVVDDLCLDAARRRFA